MPYFNNGQREIYLPEGEDPPAGFSPGRLADGGGSSERKTQLVKNPDGSQELIDAVTGETIRFFPAPAQSSGVRNLGNGVFKDETGYFVEGTPMSPAAQAAGRTGGKTYITEEEALRRTTSQGPTLSQQTAAGNLAARMAELALANRQFEEQLRQNEFNRNLAMEELGFLRDKFAVETAANNRAEARATQDQIFRHETTLRQLDMDRQQIVMQAEQFNAQAQMQTAMFNAQMQRDTDLENQRRIEAQQERRRTLARDIGLTAQDAGSRGALAAELLANPGLGELDARLAEGGDFFTDESLFPLGNLLEQREEASQAPNLLSYSPIQAPTVNVPNFLGSAISSGYMDTRPTALQNLASGVVPDAMNSTDFEDRTTTRDEQNIFNAARGLPAWAQALGDRDRIPAMAEGGFVDGMYMGDEEGPELHIPLGPGEALVIPHKEAKNFLRMTGKGASAVAGMADGGVFSEGTIFGTADLGDQSNTRNFLAQALQRALSGTPWQSQGRAPTPVEVSAPGTDPLVQELGASLSSLGTGTPGDFFLRRARALAPGSISQGIVRRTA